MPIRIYEIAKKAGVSCQVVIAKARELGIEGAKVASSQLNKFTAEFLLQNLGWISGVAQHVKPELPAPNQVGLAPQVQPTKPAATKWLLDRVRMARIAIGDQSRKLQFLLASEFLFVVSNIFMQVRYAPLFDALLGFKMKANMPAEQWDELANKQKRTDGRRNKDQEEGNLAALCAIRRCEELDAKGLLIIEDHYCPVKKPGKWAQISF